MLKNYVSHEFVLKEDVLDMFRNCLILNEKSEATIRKYLHDIRVFLDYQKNKKTVCKEDVMGYKEWLEQRYAVRSINSMLTALNCFLNFLGAEECCVRLLKVQQQTFCDKRKELSREEYFRLLKTAQQQGNIRLYLILQTICATGIRVSELNYITINALKTGTATASNKGKTRIILIPKELCHSLLVYAQEKKVTSGSVFITASGNPVNRSNIWTAMKKLCEKAGVNPSKVYPHNLRHLFARSFYQKEKDISRLADILGHKSVNTTRIYIVSSGEEHRAQINALQLTIPYNNQTLNQHDKLHNSVLCSCPST